jgi:hypothetical protein
MHLASKRLAWEASMVVAVCLSVLKLSTRERGSRVGGEGKARTHRRFLYFRPRMRGSDARGRLAAAAKR